MHTYLLFWGTLGLLDRLLVVFLVLTIFGSLIYFAVAGASYYVFFVWQKARYLPGEGPEPAHIGQAIGLSLVNILGNALLTSPIYVLIIQGYSRLYLSVDDYGWAYLLGSALAYLGFTETCVYWIHRLLHRPWFFKALHRYHHQFRLPTPWVSMAFHPLDSFAQAVPNYLCVFLLPIHVGVYTGFIVYVMLWTFLIHDRVTLFPWRAVNYTAHHTLHHLYNKCNYGQFLTFWDRIAGTYRQPPAEVHHSVIQ